VNHGIIWEGKSAEKLKGKREYRVRKDISKLICEKERHGSSRSYHLERHTKEQNQRLGYESWPFQGESASPYPFKEGMKKKFGKKFGFKQPSDFLSPIEGFLRKSIGRPWNDVYSELSKNLPRNKWLNQHVWQHIYMMVEKYAVMHNGKVCILNPFEREYEDIEDSSFWRSKRNHFYVHPQTGLLTLINAKKKENRLKAEQEKREQEYHNHVRELRKTKTSSFYAVKLENVWYEVEVKQKPAKVMKFHTNSDGSYKRDPKGALLYYWERPRVREEYLHGDVKHIPPCNDEQYIAKKRTMNHSELKRYKLI
jgi:hypothetical protein